MEASGDWLCSCLVNSSAGQLHGKTEVSCSVKAGTCILLCSGNSGVRQTAEEQRQILVIIDLYGFPFAVFSLSTINLPVLNYVL